MRRAVLPGCRGGSVPCLYPPLEATCCLWFMAPPSVWEARSTSRGHITSTPSPPLSSTCETLCRPCADLGPSREVQGDPATSRSLPQSHLQSPCHIGSHGHRFQGLGHGMGVTLMATAPVLLSTSHPMSHEIVPIPLFVYNSSCQQWGRALPHLPGGCPGVSLFSWPPGQRGCEVKPS